jgi:hypothetical protein
MSQLGERIGRRLAKRHGFQFVYDPCNFRVKSDREGVLINCNEGLGVMQWILWVDYEWPTMIFRGEKRLVEIGSDHGATEVLSWKTWHVYFDKDLSGPVKIQSVHPIFWIHNGHGKDTTEL